MKKQDFKVLKTADLYPFPDNPFHVVEDEMLSELAESRDEAFSKYRAESVQEFRFALSGQIREQVFYAIFVENIETRIKSNTIINALKQLIQQQGYHL